MDFTFSTPALLFPAVSLLFISYTNRFISYADLVRRLHERWRTEGSPVLAMQIANLRKRIVLIRNMQISGAVSLVLCVLCMGALFIGAVATAEILFGVALLAMLGSLLLLVVEVSISVRALGLQLGDLEQTGGEATSRPDAAPRG
ncbi:MAG: DUF2721 domain-containing protein [Spirochaetaceae bacterium]|nr:MAG: DUF2721 domain-containing protein [Spirochaetaceae bacterium]